MRTPQASTLSELLDSLEASIHKSVDISKLTGMHPQPKQKLMLKSAGLDDAYYGGAVKPPACSWLGFGGAAGPGKTVADMMLAVTACHSIPGIQVAFFRRTFPELEGADGAIPMSQAMLKSAEATYHSGKHVWTFKNGSKLHFCHLNEARDKYKYQSSQFGIIIIDESTHMPWDYIEYLTSRLRSVVEWPGLGRSYPFIVQSTNPGNISHAAFKKMFASNPPYVVNDVFTPNNQPVKTIFIPCKLTDNQILMDKDPDYAAKLDALNPTLRAMLRDGDWEAQGGLYFSNVFNPQEVIREFEPQKSWKYYGSVDYGFFARKEGEMPFIYLLCATDDEGHAYIVDEVGQAGTAPSDQIVAIQRLEADYGRPILYRVGCRGMNIRKQTDQPSIGEQYGANGLPLLNTTATSVSNSLSVIVRYLTDKKITIHPRCINLIDQLSNIPVSPRDPLVTDTNAPDHSIEALYNWLCSRPTPSAKVIDRTVITSNIPTVQDLMDNARRKRKAILY